MISLKKKIDRRPDFKAKCIETINQYIKDGNATKLASAKRNDSFHNKVNHIQATK